MSEQVVICEPVRTPIGRYGGALKSLTAAELGEIALRGLLGRTGLDPAAVDDVILGHCYPNSEAPAIGRVVALNAGLPVTVPGMQVDRRCGSGLQSVLQAAMQVGSGAHQLVIAGGAESMSNVPFYSAEMRWGVGVARRSSRPTSTPAPTRRLRRWRSCGRCWPGRTRRPRSRPATRAGGRVAEGQDVRL